MRLMEADLTDVEVCEKKTVKSSYVGTVSALEKTAVIRAAVKPVTDRNSTELYGERVHGMVNVITTALNVLKAGCVVKISGEDYKVLTVSHYTGFDSAAAERLQHGNEN